MSGSVRTESGLIVPASAVEKKQRVFPKDKFKFLRRFLREMDGEGVFPMLVCSDCGERIKLELVNRLIVENNGGEPILVCSCSDRAVR